jgi:hypothetical protein
MKNNIKNFTGTSKMDKNNIKIKNKIENQK